MSTRRDDSTGPADAPGDPPPGERATAPAAPRRVLVVDDYPDSAASSAMLLSLLGCDCRTASTGREALDQAAAFHPEIVLLDIGLPDLSGYEVARMLRERQGDQPLYLAAVTGWGQPEDRVRALTAGFDLHVLKPTSAATLEMILARAIAHFERGERIEH